MALESSFLTALKLDKGEKSRAQKREELLQGEKGDKILDLHSKLQELADQLDEKVERKLNRNENAFFLAYKDHMYGVQKEFKELKKKADEEETKTRRDARITALEKELHWFKNEALRLDEQCKRHKKELEKWKGKAEALEDDRQFLENQIKGAKKHNKKLRGDVEKAQSSAYSALVDADHRDAGAASGQEDSNRPPALMDADDSNNGGLSKELEQRYQTAVKRLKTQLETEQKLAARMRAVSDRQFGEPSELEAYFLNCVDRVKAEIADRKNGTAAHNKKISSSRKTSASSPAHSGDSVSLDDFTQADRRRVVELLMSSEQVLQFLYDKLFPPHDGDD